MTETLNAPKRGWVKNAAIVFLLILLILTFFSNTIMNASLPEVSVATVSAGQISTAVRGSGVVTANSVFDVKLTQTRAIETVFVRTNDYVEEGQLLFVLKGEESRDLESARRELIAAEDAYQRAVISNSNSRDYITIQRQREDIHTMTLERQELVMENIDTITDADERIVNAQDAIAISTPALEEATRALAAAKQADAEAQRSLDAAYARIQQLTIELAEAQYALDQADAVRPPDGMESLYADLDAASEAQRQAQAVYDAIRENPDATASEIEQHEATLRVANEKVREAQQAIRQAAGYNAIQLAQYEAYRKLADRVEDLRNRLALQQARHDNIRNTVKADAEAALALATATHKELEDEIAAAQKDLDDANKTIRDADTALRTKDDNIRSAERTLEDALLSSGSAGASASFELSVLQRNIDDAVKRIESLESENESSEFLSPVSGIIKTINIRAGDEWDPTRGEVMTIEMVERGYYLAFTVSNEQAETLAQGAEASITGWYWGPALRIVLASIATDQDDPRNSKRLTFSVSGAQVDSGQRLDIEVGGRGGTHQSVVPNTAIRTDSQGSFVLLIEERDTPLGRRYIARRIDVTVQARDDVNSAIAGNIVGYRDFVITISSAPVEAGRYVRLADR